MPASQISEAAIDPMLIRDLVVRMQVGQSARQLRRQLQRADVSLHLAQHIVEMAQYEMERLRMLRGRLLGTRLMRAAAVLLSLTLLFVISQALPFSATQQPIAHTLSWLALILASLGILVGGSGIGVWLRARMRLRAMSPSVLSREDLECLSGGVTAVEANA